jgi:hypothetical protein
LKKELEIKNRKKEDLRKKISNSDRLCLIILNTISNIKHKISIIKPETLLKWQHNYIKYIWKFKRKTNPVGRPQVPSEIKYIILEMKNSNNLWGPKRIKGELLKLRIELDKNTIKRIIDNFRKKGKVKPGLTWRKFLSSQIKNIIQKYVEYYNNYRPHQGIDQRIPCEKTENGNGKLKSFSILGGLHHHYYLEAA